eukprot:gnl/MRDRNA2_/MRDRNA2_41161_c0_seq1.p1 gnl/MRDRNA2_/MRDRNA2_41161_c0~~gnl/MRDRNA2_/MRDRNA2_41161_c0_seq1.p1  ORF type:complete len:658 (+),score=96.67 gnl/MRDRNA2_/MRDRNA2_41161_c0_seq1:124-2097(+)
MDCDDPKNVPSATKEFQGECSSLLHKLQDHHTRTLETILEKHHKELNSILSEQAALLQKLSVCNNVSCSSQSPSLRGRPRPNPISTGVRDTASPTGSQNSNQAHSWSPLRSQSLSAAAGSQSPTTDSNVSVEPWSGRTPDVNFDWKKSPIHRSGTPSTPTKKKTSLMLKTMRKPASSASMNAKVSISENYRQVLLTKLMTKSGLAAFVHSPFFDYITGFFIVANCLVIGIETDYNAKPQDHGNPDKDLFFKVANMVFCLFFLAELLLRVAVDKKDYFCNEDWKWAIFDVLIVITAVVEEIFAIAKTKTGMLNMTFVRILRVLRLVRVMRVIRVLRFFSELRIMVQSIMNSVKSLGWTLILLLMVIYVFGVCLTQATTEVVTGSRSCESCSQDDLDVLLWYFGDLGLTLFSLFAAQSGGITWDVIVHPLAKVSHWMAFLFVFYIALSMYTIMNVVTGVFVTDAARAAKQDEDNVIAMEIQHQQHYQQNILRIFQEADLDNSGTLTLDEIQTLLGDVRVKVFLKSLELEVWEVKAFFSLLDAEKKGFVDIDSFIEGCLRIKGQARNMDLQAMKMEQIKFQRRWEIFADYCQAQFEWLEQFLNSKMMVDACPGVKGVVRHNESSSSQEGGQCASSVPITNNKNCSVQKQEDWTKKKISAL